MIKFVFKKKKPVVNFIVENKTSVIIYIGQRLFKHRQREYLRARRLPPMHAAVDAKYQIRIFKHGRIVHKLIVRYQMFVELFVGWPFIVVPTAAQRHRHVPVVSAKNSHSGLRITKKLSLKVNTGRCPRRKMRLSTGNDLSYLGDEKFPTLNLIRAYLISVYKIVRRLNRVNTWEFRHISPPPFLSFSFRKHSSSRKLVSRRCFFHSWKFKKKKTFIYLFSKYELAQAGCQFVYNCSAFAVCARKTTTLLFYSILPST